MLNNIAILLSTYNGEKYLAVQLDSIMNQTCQDFTLYIRDDGSKDNTVNIIKKYSQKHLEHIIFIEDNKGNLGVGKSFRELVKITDADYYFFCDQDDIWNENKVDEMQSRLHALDMEYKNRPNLVYSNLKILKKQKTKQTFFNRYKIKRNKIQKGVFRGLVLGCSMCFNRFARDLYLKIKTDCYLHDGLMLVICSTFGKVYQINTPLVNYRIHNNNTIGIKRNGNYKYLLFDVAKYIFNNKAYREIFLKEYYLLQKTIEKTNLLNVKKVELWNKGQVDKLSWLKRKKWYNKHFLPIPCYGYINGIVKLFLI